MDAVTDGTDLAEVLAQAFGFAAARSSTAHIAEQRRFETLVGRRSFLMARAGLLSMRHADGWTMVVCTDVVGRPTRAEVSGKFPEPEAIARLRQADYWAGGALRAALARGRNRHSRFVVRELRFR